MNHMFQTLRSLAAVAIFGVAAGAAPSAPATGPQALTSADQHAAMVEKIQTAPWARELFDAMKNRVEIYADKVQDLSLIHI